MESRLGRETLRVGKRPSRFVGLYYSGFWGGILGRVTANLSEGEGKIG